MPPPLELPANATETERMLFAAIQSLVAEVERLHTSIPELVREEVVKMRREAR